MENLNLNKEEKLKHELKNTLQKAYPDLDFVINGLQLESDSFHYGDAIFYLTIDTHSIDTHLSDRVDIINLTNMPIKQSTIKQLKKDQQKHGYKELTTMVADVLEKHYEQD